MASTSTTETFPTAARIPQLGSVLHILASRSDFLLRTCDRIGDLYWLDLAGSRALIIGDPELAIRILTSPDGIYPDKGGATGFRSTTLPFIGSGLSTWNATDDGWRERRREFGRAYRESGTEPLEWFGKIDWRAVARADTTFDVVQEVILANLITMLLGVRPEGSEVSEVVGNIRRLSNTFWIGKLSWARPIASVRLRDAKAAVECQVEDWCTASKRLGLSAPITRHAAALGLSPSEIRDEVAAQVLSVGTTAVPAVWGLYLLATTPDVQDRLRTNLAAASDDTPLRPATGYLGWTVREVLRLCPSTYWIQRRALRDDAIAGHRVPAGTRVVVLVSRIHQHPEYWHEPSHFRPERFAAEAGPSTRYWIPFGAGPRTCIARKFVMTAIAHLISEVTRSYHLSPTASESSRLRPSFSLMPHPQPALRFEPIVSAIGPTKQR